MLKASSLKFLKDLKKNNQKEWLNANRTDYEAAKEDFLQLVECIIHSFGKKEKSIALLQPKDCTFRINRDVRFSKNKDPYKTNMGALIVEGGKKSSLAGFYFHFEPGGKSFVGGGKYLPDNHAIKKIRQEIDYCYPEFKKIITNKSFIKTYGGLDESTKLVRAPKGYEEVHPGIEMLKLKSWVAMASIDDKTLMSKELAGSICKAFEALMPLNHFLNKALSEIS